MPELPEVETVRRGLNKNVLNKEIINIKILKPKLIKNDLEKFREILVGRSFANIDRIGKLLIFKLEKEKFMLVHLKMTGQLIFQAGNNKVMGGHLNPDSDQEFPNKFSHIIFDFGNGVNLFYNDMRQFGYLKIVDKEEVARIKEKYGIEPGKDNFTWAKFREILGKKGKMTLKSFLLNQQLISGLGNIYVDEACFRSKILPMRKISTLTKKEKENLFKNIDEIIREAISMGGTTFRNYRDALGGKGNFTDKLQVYGLEKNPCKICGTIIEKIKFNGRGTHYCPNCQK